MKDRQPQQCVLDTDIGSDVDDLMALALLLKAPGVQLKGITTVYGDSALRRDIVGHVLQQIDRTEIPVIAGADTSLFDFEPPWMAGHEGQNLPAAARRAVPPERADAAEFLIKQPKKFPKEIDLFAIGPLTNLAQACLRDRAAMRNYRTIYIMGAVFGFNDPNLTMPLVEHNIKCDPEAAKIVFEAGLPIKLVPLDVTHRVPLRREDVERIGAVNTEFHRFLYKELNTWLEYVNRDYTFMHDPLTVAAALWPELFEFKRRNVMVEVAPGLCRGMTVYAGDGTTEIAVQIDAREFHGRFMRHLLRT